VVAWNGNKLQGLRSAAFANFTDPATGRTLVAAAAKVTNGMRLAEWKAAMVRAAPPISSESSSARQTTLGGEPALAWTSTASDGYHVNKLATLHGTRGYIFLASPTANDDAQNRRTFESIRRSFRFSPNSETLTAPALGRIADAPGGSAHTLAADDLRARGGWRRRVVVRSHWLRSGGRLDRPAGA
jgi:hypothetical protein